MTTASDVIEGLLRTALAQDRLVRSRQELWQRLQVRPRQQLVTMNLYDLRNYVADPDARRLVDSADAWTSDGAPLVRALRRAGAQVERVTGSDFCADLARLPISSGLSRVAVLGSDTSSTSAFGEHLRLVGRHLVFADTGDRRSWTDPEHVARLRAAAPDVVLVAVGAPVGLRTAMDVAARVQDCPVICVGAGLAMAAGTDRRAPVLVQRLGAEWLWRLAREPARLWRRYLLEAGPLLVPLFAAARRVRVSRR